MIMTTPGTAPAFLFSLKTWFAKNIEAPGELDDSAMPGWCGVPSATGQLQPSLQ